MHQVAIFLRYRQSRPIHNFPDGHHFFQHCFTLTKDVFFVFFVQDILPECVKNNIGRSRAVRMLYSAFNKSSPSRAYLAAIWFEGKIYKSLCAVAMEVNTQALAATNSSLSKNDFLSPKGTGTGTGTGTVAVGDATIATQGAGSAFNKYLANVTRLTFALQVITLPFPMNLTRLD